MPPPQWGLAKWHRCKELGAGTASVVASSHGLVRCQAVRCGAVFKWDVDLRQRGHGRRPGRGEVRVPMESNETEEICQIKFKATFPTHAA